MNITELIERLQTTGDEAISTRQKRVIANALLAQQAVIEKMLEALHRGDVLLREHFGISDDGQSMFSEALARQPDLSALREHDADVIRKVSGKIYDPIINKILFDESERIRKGEV